MPTATVIQNALKQISNQSSFFSTLLNQTLGWPVTDAKKIEDISYSWSADDLHAAELDRDLIDGVVWQIQPLEQGQPWGIFVLEFKNAKLFTAGRGMASVLRKILRGLVSSRRKQAGLPSWKREHLLFICTQGWQQFRFAYFRSKTEDPRSSRLTTFGWEPGSSNRTVCEFNLPALVWPDDSTKADKWIGDWAKAFDKDRLTNDFFKRFDQALDLIKSDLQEFQKLKSDEAYTQAQLLLERLIFLYFLQNRGWLKQDRRYLPNALEEHLKNPESFSYYGEFLEKVFWSLSTPPLSGGDRIHGLPFLNGGLFDDDEFDPSERRKKATPPLKVRNATLGGVFQNLFEAFNFTVTEDTPLNQEVAVDPEMLGKVFESIVLYAERADPDATAPDKRKATGSYYTPRIVVHFICQEVLFQYLSKRLEGQEWRTRLRALLAIDASDGIGEIEREALRITITSSQGAELLKLVKPLRCCDPAVGSGAFPVGLLHELLNLRRVLQSAVNGYVDPVRKEGSSWLQTSKQEIVQNCLFGVDIQQQAIEICRLRLWLSLVVDYDLGLDPFKAEKSEFNKAIDGISQLPNLEMNFHRGDSLHDYISGVPIVIMPEKASHYAEHFKEIANLGEQLHKAKRAERKKKLRVQILQRRFELSCRMLAEEIGSLDRDESSLVTLFHDETESSANKRKRILHEKTRLQDALGRIEKDKKELEKLLQREFDNQFYVKLRKLEGADFDSPFNFAWYIDFPGIFNGQNGVADGFDIIVGNPPFVTARNPMKRELWRGRWPLVCHGKYHLLCPFFELGFNLLRTDGELGFIVSNAFAKRDFGKPLIEKLFPAIDLQKVVDCSGLAFPGHGTPTCLVFAGKTEPLGDGEVRVVGILPGGGDLRTAPEESSLWADIADHHDDSHFTNERVVVTARPRSSLHLWPWSFETSAEETKSLVESGSSTSLRTLLETNIGYGCVTRADEVFFIPVHLIRRLRLPYGQVLPVTVGDLLRNWTYLGNDFAVFPYDAKFDPVKLPRDSELWHYLSPFKALLSKRVAYGKTQLQRGLEWYEYSMLFKDRLRSLPVICFPDIVSHGHFCVMDHLRAYKDTAPIFSPKKGLDHHLLAGLMNSSVPLFWLKQVCFNKGAGKDEERDRFEFMTGKVEQLPVPREIEKASLSELSERTKKLQKLSEMCWKLGQELLGLAFHKLFQKTSEAYQDWNSKLVGNLTAPLNVSGPFESTTELRNQYQQAQVKRDLLRGHMVALQEEMDWLVYAAYGLLPGDHPSVQVEMEPLPLAEDERPFRLLAKADGDYAKAVELLPDEWSDIRRKLWQVRLAAMNDNVHVRRIEQAVYKRRWDEQWKVGNEWRSGSVAYAAEFVDALEWWLREKAEWWLEKKRNGGPVEFDEWAQALWKDSRVNAAWPVAATEYVKLHYDKALQKAEENEESAPSPIAPATDFESFRRELKLIVDEETVAEDIPFAVPYEDLEKKLKRKIPGNVSKVRGKLNVPRERFHLRDKNQYLWAGRQFSE